MPRFLVLLFAVTFFALASASSQNAGTQQTAYKAIDGIIDGYLGSPGDTTKGWATSLRGSGSWISLSWSAPMWGRYAMMALRQK